MSLKKILIIAFGLTAAIFCGAAMIINGMFAYTHAEIHVPKPPAITQGAVN